MNRTGESELLGFEVRGLTVVELWSHGEEVWPCEDPLDVAERVQELAARVVEDTLGLDRPLAGG
jgi:hypothetical protein